MKGNFYEVEFGVSFCYCRNFIVNGIEANPDDFGEQFDREEEIADPYCCEDMQFTRHTAKAEVDKCLKKYGITKSQFDEVSATLEKGLSFGNCGLCS